MESESDTTISIEVKERGMASYTKQVYNVHYRRQLFICDGTLCTTFCPTQPNNKIFTHVTHCGNVRYILGLFHFKILVVQCKIIF